MSGHQHHGGHHHGHDPSCAEDDHALDAAAWDERYRSAPAVWSGRPNPVLVTEAADLHPGTALDVGAGEGADAIWLAARGWHVTALDISTVALERAAGHARAAGDGVTGRTLWQQADVSAWTPQRSYDLVSAHFMHLPAAQRDVLHRQLAAAVAPGGTLLVVGHASSDLETTAPRWRVPGMFFTAAEVAGPLDPAMWTVIVSEDRPPRHDRPHGRNDHHPRRRPTRPTERLSRRRAGAGPRRRHRTTA